MLFRDHADVVIPRIFHSLTTDRVLVSDFVRGKSFKDFMNHSSQEYRNRAGKIIYNFTMESNYRHGLFQADTQPANYLFQDGRVVFLDFGCVKNFPDDFNQDRINLIRSYFRGDFDELAQIYLRQGFVSNLKRVDPVAVKKLWDWILLPCGSNESFTFTHSYIKDLKRAFIEQHPYRDQALVPPHYVFSTRIEFGLNAILAELGATNNYHQIVMRHLFDGADEQSHSA